MTLPTVNQLIIELQTYKAKNITAIKLELLDRLESLEEHNADDFTVYLCDLLNNEVIDKKLKKILYKVSLILGQLFPRNRLENGKALDPISLEHIDPKHLFISLDRHQWSIVNLVNYFVTKNKYQNPVTGALFNQLDIEKMKSIARKLGLTIRLQSELTASNNHSRRFDSTTMRHQLYNFFGSSFKTTTTANSSHTVTAIAAIPFAGGIVYRR